MNADERSLTKCILAEFKTLRAEILDRLRLRTQYELLAYTIFMGLFGISFYVGYPIIFLMLIQVFLAPMIYMVRQLLKGVFKLGCYLAARTEIENFTKKLPWEYFSVEDSIEHGKRRFFRITSSHMWLFLVPMIISYTYFILIAVFSNSFVDILGDNATWDLIFVDSLNYGKIVLICLGSIIFIVNIILVIDCHRQEKTRLGLFNDYCERLRKLHEQAKIIRSDK